MMNAVRNTLSSHSKLLSPCNFSRRSVVAACHLKPKSAYSGWSSSNPSWLSTMVQQSARVLVLCGPSGSGKSTLLKLLMRDYPDKFAYSVSHTTRSPRPGEVDGKHYYFTTKEDMKAAIDKGEFLEFATFSSNMYGTSKAAVEAVVATGKICVLDIEIQGVEQVRKTDLKPLMIFIKPPSLEELEKRLRDRNTETEDSLQQRLTTAKVELEYGETPGNFDLVLVNDSLPKAYEILKNFIFERLGKGGEGEGNSGEE